MAADIPQSFRLPASVDLLPTAVNSHRTNLAISPSSQHHLPPMASLCSKRADGQLVAERPGMASPGSPPLPCKFRRRRNRRLPDLPRHPIKPGTRPIGRRCSEPPIGKTPPERRRPRRAASAERVSQSRRCLRAWAVDQGRGDLFGSRTRHGAIVGRPCVIGHPNDLTDRCFFRGSSRNAQRLRTAAKPTGGRRI